MDPLELKQQMDALAAEVAALKDEVAMLRYRLDTETQLELYPY